MSYQLRDIENTKMEELKSVDIEVNKPFSFSSVKRKTAGETYKYWNKVLKSKSFGNVENLKHIVSPNEPLPAFEEKLRLILIDSLQLENEAVNVLLSLNDYSVKRVLKFKWLFKNLSAEFCINEIFPRASVSVRFKVINKLSKYLENEEAEKLFDFVASNFGYKGAEILLPKCSSEFILNTCKKIRPLVEYVIFNRQRTLLKICQRYPETGLKILALMFDDKNENDHFNLSGINTILQYFAGNHTDLFVPFFKNYIKEFNLYRKTFSGKLSWKLFKKLNDFFFESELIDGEILNKKYIFSKLDTSQKIKFLASLVRLKDKNLTFDNWNKAKLKLVELIRCVRPSDRYSIITSIFKEVYDSNYQDHSKCWDPNLLELLPTNDRQYFAESLERYYQSSEEEFRDHLEEMNFPRNEPETAIYLYKFPVAFDRFKKIISKTPDKYKRQTIMLRMVKCCHINEEGLEEVVDFIATRHRHEDPYVLFDLANNVCTLFPNLPISVCRKMENLILFCFAKGPTDFYSITRLLEKDIYLCLESSQEADDLIKKFFEFAILKCHHYGPFLLNMDNKHSKTLLLALGEEINRWIQSHPDDNASETLSSAWIMTCEEFNRINKIDKVGLKEVFGDRDKLKKILKTKYCHLVIEDWLLDTLETCDIQFLNTKFVSKHFCRLLKRNPKLIIEHLETVLYHLDYRFYPVLVKHSHFLNVSDKIKEISLNEFQKGNCFGKRTNALNMYSRVCTIEEFADAIKEYIPEDDHVKEGADYDFTQIQLLVPKLIKHVRPAWKNLNLILKFFRGDFLKQVISSFYTCCCNSRVDFIVPFLNKFFFTVPQRVSYKKDIIRLICVLSYRDEKINFCLKCWQDEKHYSIRKILFQYLMETFLEYPTRDLFNCLVKCISESEEIMFNEENSEFERIPKEFLSEYAMALWKLSKSFNLKENFQRKIIWNFNLKNINLLSAEFCEEVLRDYLFNPKPTVSVEDFASFYCAAGPGTIGSRISVIFNLMREFKSDAYRTISFLEVLRNISHRSPGQFVTVLSILLKNWPNSHSLYEEKLLYLYYDLYYRILETSKEKSAVSVEFGKQLRGLYSKMDNLQDLTVIVTESLKKFMSGIISAGLPFDTLLVVRELIGESREKIFSIIAFGALSPDTCNVYQGNDPFKNADGDKAKLKEICNILESKNDDVLWIYFRKMFKGNEPVLQT